MTIKLTPSQRQHIRTLCPEDKAFDELIAIIEDLDCGQAAQPFSDDQMPPVVFESIGEVIWMLDRDHIIQYVTGASMDLLGYAPRSLVGRPIDPLYHADDRKAIQTAITKMIGGVGHASRETHRLRTQAGHYRWFETIFQRAPQVAGRDDYLVLTSRDITTDRQAEAARQQAQQLYGLLVRNLPNAAVFIFDQDMRYILAEGEALVAADMTPGDYIGRTLWDIFPPEIAERDEKALKAALAGETTVSYVQWGEYHYQVQTHPVTDEAGEIVGGMVMAVNISEQKHLEEALRQSEALAWSVVNSPIDSIFLLDLEGHILAVNEVVAKHFGTTREALVGENVNNYFDDDTAKARKVHFDAVKQTHQPVRIEDERVGLIFDSILYPVFDADGTIQAIAIIGRDITEKKQLEAELREKDRQTAAHEAEERLNTLKHKMMIRIAHEFRTPLTSILLAFEILDKYYERLPPERRRKHFDQVETAIRRIESLLKEMDFIVEGKTGQLGYNPSPFDMREMILDFVANTNQEADTDRLVCHIHGDLNSVIGDQLLLERVLKNLVSNALKFSPPDSLVHLEISGEAHAVIIQIADQGIGIETVDLPHIFDPFFRGQNLNEQSGLGLGMVKVNEVVYLHSGRIEIDSTINKGTTFTVTLPRQRADTES